MLQHFTNTKFRNPLLVTRVVIALQDDHVAAIAFAPFEIALPCGALTNRRNHLQELILDWQDRIFEPKYFDRRIAEGHFETEDLPQVVNHWGEVARNQYHLSESERHSRSSFSLVPRQTRGARVFFPGISGACFPFNSPESRVCSTPDRMPPSCCCSFPAPCVDKTWVGEHHLQSKLTQ